MSAAMTFAIAALAALALEHGGAGPSLQTAGALAIMAVAIACSGNG